MKLKSWLEMRHMNLSNFAKIIGVSRSQVHKYIYCGAIPKSEAMVKIFKATKGEVTPNDFYGVSSITFDRDQLCTSCSKVIDQGIYFMPQAAVYENYKMK
jgi:predicted transcriptional regulator